MSTAGIDGAIRGQDPEGARHHCLDALDAGTPWLEIARVAALAYGESADVSPEFPPHGLIALSAAVRLARHLPTKVQPLPVVEAVVVAARDRKLGGDMRRKSLKISGEISHLSHSFEYAVRAGAFDDAVSIYAGLLHEGKERAMAGDALFRVAAEDMVVGGHKLVFAVAAWRLAGALGWKAAGLVMAPAVAFVASGIRDPAAFKAFMAVLGREKMDLEAVAGNAMPADEAERTALRTAMRAPSPDACAQGVVASLGRGVTLDNIASLAVEEASARIDATGLYDLPAVHGLIFADAARWVLKFSKTYTRIYPAVQACLLLQSLRREGGSPPTAPGGDEFSLLDGILRAMESRKAQEASGLVRAYRAKGFPPLPLITLLGYEACRDIQASEHNLELACAVADEVLVHRPPVPEGMAALSRMLALSPRDRGAWPTLEKRFPLTFS